LKAIYRTIASNSAEVRRMSASLGRLCKELGFSEADSYELELAACEALVNVVRHAYKKEPGKNMTVSAGAQGNKFVLEISDTGISMKPEHVRRMVEGSNDPEPDPAQWSTLSESGRGLQIIHDVMDEISYHSEGGVNRLRMAKVLPRKNPEGQSA
jgi:serine/threonine-protein kinase RsbW